MLAYSQYAGDARIKCYVRTLTDQGHSVDVVSLKEKDAPTVEPLPTGTVFRVTTKYQGQSKFLYAWSYLRFQLAAMLLLARRTFGHRYEVVHVHNMPNLLIFAACIPKLTGARLLLDVHDLMAVNYMAKFNVGENSIPVNVLNFEQRISAAYADHVICADHNQRDYLADRCRVPQQKITVLMNLPNTELFRLTHAQEKKDDVFRIVYHGTIAYRLGIDLFLRAMAKLPEELPIELWIYGAGDYLDEVVALSTQLKLDRKVHFSRSFFPVEQISTIVSGMDLGIIGNRRNIACDKYMLPVKLLEYVYLGIPVVAPRLEVICRYFDDTMIRFYEPENVDQMTDSILQLYREKAERERLAHAAARFYEEHNIHAQGERYLELATSSRVSLPAHLAERHS
jgi:glycosyltransferase involved in cell wall biosynthesis